MTILLIIGLILSVSLNGLLIWYSISSVRKISFITEALELLNLDLEDFSKHLKVIFELEMFYGDETLKGLIIHVKDLLKIFEEFKTDFEVYNGTLSEETLMELNEQNDKNDKENQDNAGKEEEEIFKR